MTLWSTMDKAAREAAYHQDVRIDGMPVSKFGAKYGVTKAVMSGWIFRTNNPEKVRKYNLERKPSGEAKRSRWTEGRLTRKWQPKDKTAVAAKALENIKRVDTIWTENMRQRFIQYYKQGIMYKVIAHKLGVSESSCKNMRAAMGLQARRGRAGQNKEFSRTRLHLNLKVDELDFVARNGPQKGISMNDYIRGLIKKEMENEV